MYRSSVLLVVFTLFGLGAAQFQQFFGDFFGQQQQHHQQQQQRSGASQYAAFTENVGCSQYLCPATLDCVAHPAHCPCPDVQDVKCLIPDADGEEGEGTVVCVRGGTDCSQVERLMKKSI
ncbi:long chronological lifespan protein 2 [Coprinopsis sp. MPI-PUGE-AT-0042]|nr:long chronological lifespan protein 2 [Coprinopsis sp. MPI-PUGE-AT-0042]